MYSGSKYKIYTNGRVEKISKTFWAYEQPYIVSFLSPLLDYTNLVQKHLKMKCLNRVISKSPD